MNWHYERKTWRDEPATKKQLDCINTMLEFSHYPLPPFYGKTKGEAADYINEYGELGYENVNSPTFGY